MTDSQSYDREIIERFLRSDLSDPELRDVEQRLATCETFRLQVQDTAANGEWWDDASEFLSADELDDAQATGVETLIVNKDDDRSDHRADVRQIIAWLSPTDDPAMLGRIGTYEIAGVIGAGGMGVVLKGFDRALNRYVAIKVLAPHLATSGAARRRFAREAQAAAAVVHDNVVAIHGVDEAEDLPYLVMPYVRGTSLQKRIDNSGALSVPEVLRIALQTARGLAAAHDQGLVHRDIKPANILLDGTTERVLLTDFGLARAADDASLTHSGVIAGTPYFMSPEQAEGSGIDHRSDLFSLGSVMYAMCTGRPPFRAETSWGILRRVSDSTPTSIRELNAEIPAWLEGIIGKLLQKGSSHRFQSAGEVAQLLKQCLAHVQTPTKQPLPDAARDLVSRIAVESPRSVSWTVGLTVLAIIVGLTLLVAFAREWFLPEAVKVLPEEAGISQTKSPIEPDVISSELPEWNTSTLELNQLRDSVDSFDQQSSDFWK